MRIPATFATVLMLAVPAKLEASEFPGGCNTRACLKRTCHAVCQARVKRKAVRRHRLQVIAPYRSWLRALRMCESTDNYGAVDPTGAFRGAYQFTRGTWKSVGGTGDPAVAPRLEQDYRAVLLRLRLTRQGISYRSTAGWPVCA